MPPTRFTTLADRLNADLDKDGDCWLWLGYRHPNGYGMFTYRRKTTYAHRAAYEAFVGPIPENVSVMHSCDTPDCCNPAHLSLGTRKDNSIDMARKRRGAHQHNLSDDDVHAIRQSRKTAAEVAEEYGIGRQTVYGIRQGRRWSHVA